MKIKGVITLPYKTNEEEIGMEWAIRYAVPSDALFLSSISVGSKKYGENQKETLEMSQNQLTITENYIAQNTVLVAEIEETIIGYCSMIEVKRAYWKDKTFIRAGYWLEHLFIRPAYMKSNIGDQLIEALILHCEKKHIPCLNLLSDTDTNVFFEKIGAKYVKALRSSLKGRKVHLFERMIGKQASKVDETQEVEAFNKQTFEEELKVLENKRIHLEKKVMEQKLYELDKEIDEQDEEIEQREDHIEEAIEEYKDVPEEYVEEEVENFYSLSEEQEEDLGEVAEAAEIYSVYIAKKQPNVEPYIPWGDQISADRSRARRLLREFNRMNPESKKQMTTLLKQLFGSIGEHIHIEPDFKCNFGYNIHLGNHFYADYNCVILDNEKVTIGENCILSPQVGIYTVAYPDNREQRIAGYEYALPITIGNDVWIGGGTVICPGVTIGDNVIIRPGSVVSLDIPSGVIAGGNPARKLENIRE